MRRKGVTLHTSVADAVVGLWWIGVLLGFLVDVVWGVGVHEVENTKFFNHDFYVTSNLRCVSS